MKKMCYWTVCFGTYTDMTEAMIKSARNVGVDDPFVVYADREIKDSNTLTLELPHGFQNDNHYLFKLDYLKDVGRMFYDYFTFIDADSYFVRHPGDLIRYCHDGPIHFTMESNCNQNYGYRKDWWGCSLPEFCQLMWEKGVRSKMIFNLNAGLWTVKREAILHVHRLGYEFWNHAQSKGYTFTEEAALAYAGHMLMGNVYKHRLVLAPELWASDWMGHFAGRLPIDEPWIFHDYMTDEHIHVQPAIVHAMRSKEILIEHGRAAS